MRRRESRPQTKDGRPRKGGQKTDDGRPHNTGGQPTANDGRHRTAVVGRANEILREIRDLMSDIDQRRESAEDEMREVRERHQEGISPLLQQLASREAEIQELMKEHKAEVFKGRDRTELEHGVLLHLEDCKVTIPRAAAEKIISQLWPVRISISINRRAIEAWPEQWLADMGITRKPVEIFSYEVRR